jgi:uncharacterized membrane protein
MLSAVTAAGFAGAVADSLLGAALQARYRCPACDAPTERRRHRCGAATARVGGVTWIDNDVVNFFASCAGALAAAAALAAER